MRFRMSQSLAKISALTAILFLSVASTPDAPAAKPKPEADFFPLRVGDSWTFRNTESGGYTWKVLSDEPQEGGTPRYVVEFRSEVIILSVFSKADGWVLLHSENYPEHEGLKATYEPPRRYLSHPLAVGQKWEWTGKDPTQVERHEKSRVVGFENVTVPAGKFRAMKVVSEVSGGAIPLTKTCWYAPGVGLVKTANQGGQIQYGSELTDYSFKPKAAK
jgi:hypothetical protein